MKIYYNCKNGNENYSTHDFYITLEFNGKKPYLGGRKKHVSCDPGKHKHMLPCSTIQKISPTTAK